MCGRGVAKSEEVGRGVTSVETPKAVADVWGAHRRRRDQSKRGLGGLTLEGALVFYSVAGRLLLESCPCQTGATLRNIKVCLKREAT